MSCWLCLGLGDEAAAGPSLSAGILSTDGITQVWAPPDRVGPDAEDRPWRYDDDRDEYGNDDADRASGDDRWGPRRAGEGRGDRADRAGRPDEPAAGGEDDRRGGDDRDGDRRRDEGATASDGADEANRGTGRRRQPDGRSTDGREADRLGPGSGAHGRSAPAPTLRGPGPFDSLPDSAIPNRGSGTGLDRRSTAPTPLDPRSLASAVQERWLADVTPLVPTPIVRATDVAPPSTGVVLIDLLGGFAVTGAPPARPPPPQDHGPPLIGVLIPTVSLAGGSWTIRLDDDVGGPASPVGTVDPVPG